jgi:galactokinase
MIRAMPLDRFRVAEAFSRRFHTPPHWVVRAPGRVNLIGEHTDYNDGFVLPLAIDRAVWIALAPRDDHRVVVHSVDFDQDAIFTLDNLAKDSAGWPEYLKGVAWSLQEAGYRLAGWEGLVWGDVPRGAGLSSSAALEIAAARAFAATSGFPWQETEMARLGQRAENQWVGVNCGIMDQLISAAGRADHALLIDCRSLAGRPVPFPSGTAVAVLDTSTRRGLVDSAYNQRRAACEAAAQFFARPALRDVDPELFTACSAGLDPVTLRRARHVITENRRTLDAADAMARRDPAAVGRLMIDSHRSLRDDYEVCNDALDAMVDCARDHAACYGARMTGAGFGGCAVALVDAAAGEAFCHAVAAAYRQRTGLAPQTYVCQATNGAELFMVEE